MVGIATWEYEGRFPRILCGANPGNIGHLWVKQTWMNSVLQLEIKKQPRKRRMLINQRVSKIMSMAEDDPEYEARLEGLARTSRQCDAMGRLVIEGPSSIAGTSDGTSSSHSQSRKTGLAFDLATRFGQAVLDRMVGSRSAGNPSRQDNTKGLCCSLPRMVRMRLS